MHVDLVGLPCSDLDVVDMPHTLDSSLDMEEVDQSQEVELDSPDGVEDILVVEDQGNLEVHMGDMPFPEA